MATQVIDLTPAEQSFLDSTPQDLFTPTTPRGIAFKKRSLDRESFRKETCGHIRVRRCAKGHLDKRMSLRCGFRYACDNDCAKIDARERFEAWEPQLKAIMKSARSEKFTALEIFCPIERDRESIKQAIKRISASLKALNVGGQFPVHFIFPVAIVGNYLKTRVIVLAEDVGSTSPWNIWGTDVKVSFHTFPMYRLAFFFEHEFLTPHVIEDPDDAIDQEILFKGVHRLRAVGIKTDSYKTDEDEREDISVEAIPTTEMSTAKKHAHDRCKECGSRFVSQSTQWIPHYTYFRDIEWEDLPPDID